MADIYSAEKRSEIMSAIKGTETSPEILVRKFLFANGFRFRKNDMKLPGKPDIVLPKHKVIILIHGCFWHGHEKCKAAALPATRREFWRNKISATRIRDKRNKKDLLTLGYKVIVIWQCQLKNMAESSKTLSKLLAVLRVKC